MARERNLLVITLSNIGDVILTTPVIASVRVHCPEAKLTVVVGPRAAPLLEGSRQIDRLLIYDKNAGLWHKLALLRALNEASYDYVVDLRNTILPFLVHARKRSPIFRWNQPHSARDQHIELLIRSGLEFNEAARFDFFSEEDKLSLTEKLNKKGLGSAAGIVTAPGARSEDKRWSLEGFGKVILGLLDSSDLPVFVVGDSNEAALGELLSEMNPQRIFNLCGEITLRELAYLISLAKLVLTNDSAAMHLGYELFRPVVAVFGPTDHQRYGRETRIWKIVRNTTPPFNLNDITSEKVLRASQELLHGNVSVG